MPPVPASHGLSDEEDAPLSVRRNKQKRNAVIIIDDDDDEQPAPIPLTLLAPARAQAQATQKKKPAATARQASATEVAAPASARKGGKWTVDQDEELSELVLAHGDGTKESWAMIAEMHSRGASATALKTRLAQLPELGTAAFAKVEARERFRRSLIPALKVRCSAVRHLWLHRWAAVVHQLRAEAAFTIQRTWRPVFVAYRRAAIVVQRRVRVRQALTAQVATRLQRAARRRLSRRVLAATTLQSRARAQSARRSAEGRRLERVRAVAAATIATAWQRLLIRKAKQARVARANDPDHRKRVSAFVNRLEKMVCSRRFDLSEVSGEVMVNSARIIKPMAGWEGKWPALRELMQNTIDHLGLLGEDGKLHPALRIECLVHEPAGPAASAASATAAPSTRSAEEATATTTSTLREGATVVLQGLMMRPELNGKRATILSYDAEKRRYQVDVQSARLKIAISAEKLRPPPPPPSASKPSKSAPKRPGEGAAPAPTYEIQFICSRLTLEEVVCAITIQENELVIEQAYTFPLHPRALDTGVEDISKQGTASAGGFGDGFKTAAIALLAQGGQMDWTFEADGRCITWAFVGEERKAVGKFAAGKVLSVAIKGGKLGARCEGVLTRASHRMVQRIRLTGVGKAFRLCAMRRLQIFWRLDPAMMLSPMEPVGRCDERGQPKQRASTPWVGSSSFLADARRQPSIDGTDGEKPEPGVYVRGIWVEAPVIAGTILSFDASCGVSVSGRDRNSVLDEDKREGAMNILRHCHDRQRLRHLLLPLKGKAAALSPSQRDATRRDEEEGDSGSSWLLRSPDWLSHLLTAYRDEFLEMLGVPKNTVFSHMQEGKGSMFRSWALGYLRGRHVPAELLRPGANAILFTETADLELRVLTIVELLAEEDEQRAAAPPSGSRASTIARLVYELLSYTGLQREVRAHVRPAVQIAFAHRDFYDHNKRPLGGQAVGSHLFVPASRALTKLGVCDIVQSLMPCFPQLSRLGESHALLQYVGQAAANGAFDDDKELDEKGIEQILSLAERFKQRADGGADVSIEKEAEKVATLECGKAKPGEMVPPPQTTPLQTPPPQTPPPQMPPQPPPMAPNSSAKQTINLISDSEDDSNADSDDGEDGVTHHETATSTKAAERIVTGPSQAAPGAPGTPRSGPSQTKASGSRRAPACTQVQPISRPTVIEKSRYDGQQSAREEEHEMRGSLVWRQTADAGGTVRELYVGEHDEPALERVDERPTWTLAFRRFERALAEVVACTGSKLPVFAAYAPSETGWYGLNMGRAYALINIGVLRSTKEYKWTIVHELAHQRGTGHDKEFNQEFQLLAILVDRAEDDE